MIASILHNRKSAGADMVEEYIRIARQRIDLLLQGKLKLRPMGKPIFEPPVNDRLKNVGNLFSEGTGDEKSLWIFSPWWVRDIKS